MKLDRGVFRARLVTNSSPVEKHQTTPFALYDAQGNPISLGGGGSWGFSPGYAAVLREDLGPYPQDLVTPLDPSRWTQVKVVADLRARGNHAALVSVSALVGSDFEEVDVSQASHYNPGATDGQFLTTISILVPPGGAYSITTTEPSDGNEQTDASVAEVRERSL